MEQTWSHGATCSLSTMAYHHSAEKGSSVVRRAGPGYGADLVSHEATFSEGMEQKAMVAQHSTARMAGEFAQQLQAQTLVLTHFSARYSANQV